MSQFWYGVAATLATLVVLNFLLVAWLWLMDRRSQPETINWECFLYSLNEEETP